MRWRTGTAIVLCGLATLVFLLYRTDWKPAIPEQWNPWASLDVGAPPNWLTRIKLSRLTGNGPLCREILGQTALEFKLLEDKETAPGCGFTDAILIDRSTVAFSEPFSLSCPAAVSLALWEQHVLQPAAASLLGSRVVLLEHFGSYACRPVYGREGGRLSQHATANALDVAGFVLEDGRRIRVLGEWADTGADGEFLARIRDGACPFFDAVLGPDYNAAHRDHFHLDRGGARICR